ncbi:DNA cytosine methyltransferase [Thalassotalea aquiviva]|uniref:DNA cytosine methyltransferase n=1 Tax=Thalassotalea aquiviva TaxID=3242415 RepID=UPI00352B1F0B
MINKQLTFIDLFAGAGGFGLGFENAGFRQLYAVEIDKWAAETHRFNFPRVPVIEQDICEITNEEILELSNERPDVIIGGPPCQGFSHANIVNKDPKDPRNSLFEEFIRFVDVLQPRVCIIENVPALLKTKTALGEQVIDVITSELERMGFSTSYELLDARNFGVPQKRQRLFVIGVNKKYPKLLKESLFPSPTHNELGSGDLFNSEDMKQEVTLWDAISDLPQRTFSDFDCNESYQCLPKNEYQELMRANSNGLLTNAEPMRHTQRVIDRFKEIKIGQSEGNVTQDNMPKKRGNPSTISEKRYSQNSRRQSPNSPCNSVVASSHSNFIHPYLHRNFTVRELLRIQSFPDRFELKGKRAVLSKKLSIKKGLLDDIYLDQRMQVGNAVPPLLSEDLARNIAVVLTERGCTNVA